jgi:hypothetical protein
MMRIHDHKTLLPFVVIAFAFPSGLASKTERISSMVASCTLCESTNINRSALGFNSIESTSRTFASRYELV